MSKLTLKAARVNAGLTIKDVAVKIGRTPGTVCSWENGQSEPKLGDFFKLMDIYGTDPRDIAVKEV